MISFPQALKLFGARGKGPGDKASTYMIRHCDDNLLVVILVFRNQYNSPPLVVVNEVNSGHGKVMVRGYHTKEMGKRIVIAWEFQRCGVGYLEPINH